MAVSPPPPAGWYPDPTDARQRRWWDGISWSDQTAPFPAAPGMPPLALLHAESPNRAQPQPQSQPQPQPQSQPVAARALAVPATSVPPAYRPLVPGTGSALGSGYTPPPIGAWRSPADTRPLVRGMGDAIRVVFARYVDFEGRATRAEFWYFTLFSALVTFGAMILTVVPFLGTLFALALFAWGLGVLLPSLAVTVRRLRDAGLHWAWLFLSLLPFGGIALIVLCCQPSKYP